MISRTWLEGKRFIASPSDICILFFFRVFSLICLSFNSFSIFSWNIKRNKIKSDTIKIPFTHDLFLTFLSPDGARCSVHPQFFPHKCVERAGRSPPVKCGKISLVSHSYPRLKTQVTLFLSISIVQHLACHTSFWILCFRNQLRFFIV